MSVSIIIIISLCLIVAIVCLLSKRSRGESGTDIPAKLLRFLELANVSYIKAYERCDSTVFAPFCITRFVESLQDVMFLENLPSFGNKSYRKVTWSYGGYDSELKCVIIQRQVEFQSIKIRGVRMPLGDDGIELWYIGLTNKSKYGFEVIHIM